MNLDDFNKIMNGEVIEENEEEKIKDELPIEQESKQLEQINKSEALEAVELLNQTNKIKKIKKKIAKKKQVKRKHVLPRGKKYEKIDGDKTVVIPGGKLYFISEDSFYNILEGIETPDNKIIFKVFREFCGPKTEIGNIFIKKGVLQFRAINEFGIKYNEFPIIERVVREANRSIIKYCSNKYLPLQAKRVIMKMLRDRYVNIKINHKLLNKNMFTYSSFHQAMRNNQQIFDLGIEHSEQGSSSIVIIKNGIKACLDILCNQGIIKRVMKKDVPAEKIISDVYQLTNNEWYKFEK